MVVVCGLSPAKAAGIPAAVANCRDAFLEIDILQFAGLSLIVMAVIRELKVNRYVLLLLAALITCVSPSLWGIGSDLPVAGHVLDYLWGNKPSAEACIGNLVSFPFFPWFAFVLLGMFLGDVLTKSPDIGKTFRKIGSAGLVISVASLVAIVPDYHDHFGDYYHSRPLAVALEAGIVLLCLYLCQLAIEKLPMNKAFEILFHWSRDVNRIYLVQWVLIMWGGVCRDRLQPELLRRHDRNHVVHARGHPFPERCLAATQGIHAGRKARLGDMAVLISGCDRLLPGRSGSADLGRICHTSQTRPSSRRPCWKTFPTAPENMVSWRLLPEPSRSAVTGRETIPSPLS